MPDRPDHDQAAIEARAAELLTQRDAGWTREAAAEFALWRALDPRHDAAVRRIEATQHLLARLPESPAAAALFAEAEALCRPRARVTRIFPWLLTAGALTAAACAAFVFLRPQPAAPHATLAFAATANQHRTVDLTDGSTLLLNSGSEVDVDYQTGERRVNLRHGEVHFSVAKDARRPFVVAAGVVQVRAVGTAFNVKREPAGVDVIVTEGKVRVTRDRPAGAGEELFLVAGESAVIDARAATLPGGARLSPDLLRTKLAWQAPWLEFKSTTTLADAVAQFNRYSRVQLEIADPALGQKMVGGSFYANQAEEFVSALLLTGDIRVERASETRYVLRLAH